MTGSSGRHTKPTVTRICCVTCQPFGALSRSTVATLYYKLSRAPTAILRSANERMKPVADPEIWNKWGGRRGCRVWGKFLFFCAKIVHFRAKFSPVLRCIRSMGGGRFPFCPPPLNLPLTEAGILMVLLLLPPATSTSWLIKVCAAQEVEIFRQKKFWVPTILILLINVLKRETFSLKFRIFWKKIFREVKFRRRQ